MRRIALWLAGAAAALVAAFAAVAAWKPLDGAEAAVLAAMRETPALRVETNGRTTVSLFPTPEVRIDGVSLAEPGSPPFAVARELIGSPRIAALLMGRIELGAITLRGAEVELDRLPFDALFAAMRETTGRDAAPPEVRIVDGRLDWSGRSIEGVQAGLAWPGANRPLLISGFGVLAGRPLEATFSLADPRSLAQDQPAPFRARLEGGGARIVFDGSAVDAGGPRFTGDLSVRASSLRETLKWLGAPAPRRSSPLSGFSLAGKATADRDGLSISNAEFGLEGGSFLGAGRLRMVSGRASVEATLDSDKLDLGPYVKGIAPAMRQDGAWNPKPIDLSTIAGFDLDLRLSAATVKLGPLRLGPTAATVLISEGGFDLAIGEASAFGGTLGGRLSIAPDKAGARVRAQVAVQDVDVKDALKRALEQPILTGTMNGDLAVEGAGRSMSAVVASLGGHGAARIADGTFEGFGRSRTLALAGLRGGMSFNAARMSVAIADGVAHTDDLKIDGPDGSFALSGDARLVQRDLKLTGFVRPADAAWTLPVKMEGPFWAPKLKPNLSGGRPHAEASRSNPAVASGR